MKLKYQQLTDYLVEKLPKKYRPNFYSWIQSGHLVNEGRNETPTGVEIGIIETECVFWFEELPFKEIDPIRLMAHIQIWLNENNDCDRLFDENDRIPFDLMLLDDSTADLQFTLNFKDLITLQVDENGEFLTGGQGFSLMPIDICYAENISIEVKMRHKNKWQKQD